MAPVELGPELGLALWPQSSQQALAAAGPSRPGEAQQPPALLLAAAPRLELAPLQLAPLVVQLRQALEL